MRLDEEADDSLTGRLSSTDGAPRLNSCWYECNRSGGLRARRLRATRSRSQERESQDVTGRHDTRNRRHLTWESSRDKTGAGAPRSDWCSGRLSGACINLRG